MVRCSDPIIMADQPAPVFRVGRHQRLTVAVVDDPAQLAVLEEQFRRSRRLPRGRRWWLAAAVTAALGITLLVGVLIGRFLLAGTSP
jgi:hypothetical protein